MPRKPAKAAPTPTPKPKPLPKGLRGVVKASKTANVENTGRDTGVMTVPQPHGGALRVGGNPGNRGGTGRRPNVVRRRALAMLAGRLDVVGQIADGAELDVMVGAERVKGVPRPAERLQALKLLADVGFGPQVAVADVRERLVRQLQVIREREVWTREALLTALAAVWK